MSSPAPPSGSVTGGVCCGSELQITKWSREMLSPGESRVVFVYLRGSKQMIEDRLRRRENHYFKADMIQTQFAALEVGFLCTELFLLPYTSNNSRINLNVCNDINSKLLICVKNSQESNGNICINSNSLNQLNVVQFSNF